MKSSRFVREPNFLLHCRKQHDDSLAKPRHETHSTHASFIGSLQRGLTGLIGDPDLKKERLTQIDFGVEGNYENVKLGAHGYFSWIDDMITYDLLTPTGGEFDANGFPVAVQFANTEKAILASFEVYGEADVNP